MWDRKEKPIVFVIFCLPLIWLLYSLFSARYFPDPAEPFMTLSGIWSAIFISLTLSLSILAKIPKLKVISRYRRFIGLTAFWYSALHLLAYLVLHAGFSWVWISEDVFKRPYIYVGVAAFLIMLVLALTSSKRIIKKLGKKWKTVHRFLYLASLFVIAHLWWQVKSNPEIAIWLTLIVIIPLVIRLKETFLNKMKKRLH
ncbi:sulfoxide reductase heme-binding subunit YedZ [Marinomonas sp. 15G1-11]|uniref:Protein-methionine-sulfoxide reductase heme-binding subunit MsrQ n=1 Tax=Marinomonas phaeophyticola TaxID=3004091 RepID=A0ABT4JSL9_9GAMM|nr:protein-methionine-sulfoxide reductase heme-binding subunit MsrQ [Marinomonas sp. 15G1-11]MCZ2721245.1 sulfoxide reductase heme-binding subunit YedZ [Marinomonas sp. 15G1-11]